MSENELLRLLKSEKDAHARYVRMTTDFGHFPEIIEAALSLWGEAKAALLKHEGHSEA